MLRLASSMRAPQETQRWFGSGASFLNPQEGQRMCRGGIAEGILALGNASGKPNPDAKGAPRGTSSGLGLSVTGAVPNSAPAPRDDRVDPELPARPAPRRPVPAA